MTVSREKLLAASKCPTETVNAPELGGEIRLRGMTGRELIAFQRSLDSKKKGNGVDAEFPAKLLVQCIVDNDGSRLLLDEDWNAILDWPGAVVQRLTTVALRLSGYGDDGGNS